MDQREKKIYRVTLVGSAVNALLIVLKFVAGVVGRSSAMVADAVHSLSDFITDVIVLVFVRIAGKPRDKGHDYGHGKFETLATLIIGIILAVPGVGLVAVGSIVSKEALYRYTRRSGRELDSPAVVANAWHHRSDAMSSGGTLVGIAGAMFLGDRWRILDPLAAIVVSLFIIKSGYDIMRPCIGELLEASLPEEEEREIEALVRAVPGIEDVHNLRTRRIGNGIAVDLHARADGRLSLAEAHDKATEAENAVRRRFGPNSIINIHMEPTK